MIQDIGQYSPHELVWSLIRDDNLDNVFDSNDHFYSLLTTQLGDNIAGSLTWTELAHMAVYNPVLFDRYYADNNIAAKILTNSEATTTALLQTYLDAFDDYIESDKSSLYTDANDSGNADNKLLFEHLFDQALGDAYTASLDSQLTKLNGYLFLLDPNHPVDTNYTSGVADANLIDRHF